MSKIRHFHFHSHLYILVHKLTNTFLNHFVSIVNNVILGSTTLKLTTEVNSELLILMPFPACPFLSYDPKNSVVLFPCIDPMLCHLVFCSSTTPSPYFSISLTIFLTALSVNNVRTFQVPNCKIKFRCFSLKFLTPMFPSLFLYIYMCVCVNYVLNMDQNCCIIMVKIWYRHFF